jgi:hypothetical protein
MHTREEILEELRCAYAGSENQFMTSNTVDAIG